MNSVEDIKAIEPLRVGRARAASNFTGQEAREPQFAGFATVSAALAYRNGRGGWVFSSDAGVFIWFNPTFTPTKIFTHFVTRGLNGKLL